MNTNRMKDVSIMFGLNFGEPFIVIGNDGKMYDGYVYHFDEYGVSNSENNTRGYILQSILNGSLQVCRIKLLYDKGEEK